MDTEEKIIDYAVIRDGLVENVVVINEEWTLEQAETFLKAVYGEGIVVLPAAEGYGIGDSYADGVWTKKAEPAEDNGEVSDNG